jgi:polyphenol oxidase
MLTPQIPAPFPLRWGFSTKLDDQSTLPSVRLSQVHGCGVVESKDAIQESDGIWTTAPGVRIGVRVADCVPILLAGLVGDKPWISALHAGWRGATAGILRHGIAVFKQRGGKPSDLVWAFGPCIQTHAFEVGTEVVEAAKQDRAWNDGLAFLGPKGKPHLDLHGLLRAQALDEGLDPLREGSIPLCTFTQKDLFWSYRRGDRDERQWGWIEIL